MRHWILLQNISDTSSALSRWLTINSESHAGLREDDPMLSQDEGMLTRSMMAMVARFMNHPSHEEFSHLIIYFRNGKQWIFLVIIIIQSINMLLGSYAYIHLQKKKISIFSSRLKCKLSLIFFIVLGWKCVYLWLNYSFNS